LTYNDGAKTNPNRRFPQEYDQNFITIKQQTLSFKSLSW